MRILTLATAAFLSLGAVSAYAQVDPATGARPGREPGVGDSLPRSDKASNIMPYGTSPTNVAPTLPSPGVGDNAATFEYLRVARAALVAGRTGQAQQALEMAETRSLDRVVPQAQVNQASDSVMVGRIRDARQALGSGNRTQAIQLIDLALAG